MKNGVKPIKTLSLKKKHAMNATEQEQLNVFTVEVKWIVITVMVLEKLVQEKKHTKNSLKKIKLFLKDTKNHLKNNDKHSPFTLDKLHSFIG